MTSGHDSSGGTPEKRLLGGVESLSGAWHPHTIGVQDFAHYALIVDVRRAADYERDHIPGAVRISPLPARRRTSTASVPAELSSLLCACEKGEPVLAYCGRGGLDSQSLAAALRMGEFDVDVLPGGWTNYRRWVQVGLTVLPRLIMFRVLAATSIVAHRELMRLAGEGQQVLDIQALVLKAQPVRGPSYQAWFESLLLQALRRIDPRRPVWVNKCPLALKGLRIPGALKDALHAAASS